MSEPTCFDCRFWRNKDEHEYGECRRHAPQPVIGKQAEEWSNMAPGPEDYDRTPWWPMTHWEEWCGEHQIRLDP